MNWSLCLNCLFFGFGFSFFEKISTGSNTDSDLRVVRFDAYGRHEEVKAGTQGGDSNNDTVPKFKKPVPSKN